MSNPNTFHEQSAAFAGQTAADQTLVMGHAARSKTVTSLAMLTALTYVAMLLSKLLPQVSGFLQMDVKDTVVCIGGFLFGPLSAAIISIVVALVEMFTVSDTGPIGLVMNVLATCAFCCTASFVYKKMRTRKGAVLGLALGTVVLTVVMILWNYLITPLYMGIPRETVASMLPTVFLPFNLVKGGLNMALILLLYKPVVTALRKARLAPERESVQSGDRFDAGFLLFSLALLATFVLLVLVLIPGVGITRNHATRWLGIPGVQAGQFQPSEVAKLGIIIYFAQSISSKREKMKTWREGFLPHIVILLAAVLLIGKEPHLSGAILIFGIGAAMMVVGGIHWGWIAAGLASVGTAGYVVLFTDFMEKVVKYNASRITVWRDPFGGTPEFQRDQAWQTIQSLITVGSGGLLGVGLGKSRQKFMFLPEEHNDFIFAVVFEELGLVGATLIMALFAMLIIRGFWLAIHARDRFGSLLVVGVTTQIALQTFLNIAVVTNLIPNTGISLPFFSYGGTALAIQLVEVGIVLSVSRQIKAPKAG